MRFTVTSEPNIGIAALIIHLRQQADSIAQLVSNNYMQDQADKKLNYFYVAHEVIMRTKDRVMLNSYKSERASSSLKPSGISSSHG